MVSTLDNTKTISMDARQNRMLWQQDPETLGRMVLGFGLSGFRD